MVKPVVAAVLAFIIVAVGVNAVLSHVWPTQHDLSDIGTGLMRLGAAALSGLVAAIVAASLSRPRR